MKLGSIPTINFFFFEIALDNLNLLFSQIHFSNYKNEEHKTGLG